MPCSQSHCEHLQIKHLHHCVIFLGSLHRRVCMPISPASSLCMCLRCPSQPPSSRAQAGCRMREADWGRRIGCLPINETQTMPHKPMRLRIFPFCFLLFRRGVTGVEAAIGCNYMFFASYCCCCTGVRSAHWNTTVTGTCPALSGS